jgi:hypothetical protein
MRKRHVRRAASDLPPGGSELRELLRRGDPAQLLASVDRERMRATVLDEAGRASGPRAAGLPAGQRWWRAVHSRPGVAAATASGLVLVLTALLLWKVSWPPPSARDDGSSRVTAPVAESGHRGASTALAQTAGSSASMLPRQIQFWTPRGTHIIWRLVRPSAAPEAGEEQ